MKRTLVSIILFLIVVCAIILGIFLKKNDDNSNLTKIKVAEVAHSIFYAPQYIAINEGYFEDEGIQIELILTPGADAVMSSVLSGDVDIGFSVHCCPSSRWATISGKAGIVHKDINLFHFQLIFISLFEYFHKDCISGYIYLQIFHDESVFGKH